MKKTILVLLAVILLAQSAAVLAEKQVFAYQGEVAFFEENGLIGLQDKAGNVLHKAEFTGAWPFDANNIAHVYLADGTQGFIDRAGNYAIEPMVGRMGYMQVNDTVMLDKVFYITDGGMGLLSLSGEKLLPPEYSLIFPFSKDKNLVEKDGKWAYADNQGNRLYGLFFDDTDSDNMFGIIKNDQGTKYYNADGVCIYQETPAGIQYADEKGNPIDVSAWDRLYIGREYKQGFIHGEKNGKKGVMDIQGNTVIEPKWQSVWLADNGYFRLRADDSVGYYMYNAETKVLKKLEGKNGNKPWQNAEGCILYGNEENKYWGFMDYEGNILSKISNRYERDPERWMSGGLIWTENKGQIYFFDKYGHSITSKQWEIADDFNEGYAKVKINNKWGVINTKGEIVVEPIWDRISGFDSDYGPLVAVVQQGDTDGWINTKGELLCPN